MSAESRLQLLLRLRGTVVLKIWKQLVFMTLYTTTIVCIHQFVPALQFTFGLTLIPVLGVVTGLLLVFRTNTAYDRYWEGRRLWATMTQHMRTIVRLIWVGVKEKRGDDIIEKKTAINVVVAFAYATKCYLREEYAYDNEEFRDLVKHLPQFVVYPTNPISNGNGVEKKKHSVIPMPEENGLDKKRESVPAITFAAHDLIPATNIPVELSYYICSYIEYLRAREMCDGSLLWTMTSAVGNLMDCLAGFERILRTPIPLAYSVHLHHAVWLYLLALPYQLTSTIFWWTIPAVTLASFSLLGILEIGWEIENPFGYDDNDLPLNDYCTVIRNEANTITGHGLPEVQTWLWSSQNQPLAPNCKLNATQLAEKSVEEIRLFLSKGERSEGCRLPPMKSTSLMNLYKKIDEGEDVSEVLNK